MDPEIIAMENAIRQAFAAIGVKTRMREEGNEVVASMLIPSVGRPIVIHARVALPSDAIGAMVGKKGKFRKKIKKVAKAVAHSKLVRKVGKLLPMLTAVVPGGQVLSAGLAAVRVAKAVKAGAKSHNPKTRKLAKRAALVVKAHVDNAKTQALVPPPGYPEGGGSSAEQPDPENGFGEAPALTTSNGFPDDDVADTEATMDPENDADVEVPQDTDIEVDADTDDEGSESDGE